MRQTVSSWSMNDPIAYRLQPIDPPAHLYRVRLHCPQPDATGQAFRLPAWIPGSYKIRDFARHIVAIRAHDSAGAIPLHKTDKQTWRAAPCEGALTLEYEVYAWDLSVRGAHLDQTHGYFNGTSVFLAVMGQEERPCRVELAPPEGAAYAHWRVATSLPEDGAERFGFGRYRAESYQDLIDHPVEMGSHVTLHFQACGVAHEIHLYGRLHPNVDLERLADDMIPICAHHIRLFGEPAPMARYVFLLMVVGEGYGGLEHRYSSSNMCNRDDLPRQGEREASNGYQTLLGLLSHEYFHAWNVKRIKPEVFTPYELSRERHTQLLWAFEGITSYFDDLALVRAGRIAPKRYLELLSHTMTRVRRGHGRTQQTLLESSFDAWTKYYQQDENAPNAIVSYYAKGALVALCLDLLLRREGRVSLDDVMRALWTQYGRTGVGVPETAIETLASRVSGLDLNAFFDQTLRGVGELPLKECLAGVGVALTWRPATGQDDPGGAAADRRPRPALGARIGDSGDAARLTQVFAQGAARKAGLSAGDVVIAVDGLQVNRANLEARLAALPLGTTAQVHAFRRDELMTFTLPLEAGEADTAVLRFIENADAGQQARRAQWLGLEAA